MNKKLLQLDTDEFCQWLDTPIGRVIVYANNSDLVKIDIIPSLIFLKDPTNKVVVNENKQPISPKPNWLTEKAIEQVESYFAGELTAFDLPIPFSDDSFCNRACLNLYNNYFGQTISYKQLATVTGNSRASRAAGHAMSSNPVPIVVPCHRVLASNGSLGGFLYGLKMKTWLIKHEQKTMIRLKAQSIHEFSDDEVSKLLSVESLKPMFAKMPVKRNFHFYNDPFVSLVTSLIYQQINYKTAVSIEGKFLSHFNYQPTAEQLVCLNDKEFRRFGISAGKAKYIRNVSEFFIQHNGLIKKLITTNDYQKIAELLIEIKGVGDWTIEMFLLFCLRDPHILSVKDLIIMNGLKYILKTDDISPSLLKSFRDSISGIESLVSINIWQFIEGGYINAREVI